MFEQLLHNSKNNNLYSFTIVLGLWSVDVLQVGWKQIIDFQKEEIVKNIYAKKKWGRWLQNTIKKRLNAVLNDTKSWINQRNV